MALPKLQLQTSILEMNDQLFEAITSMVSAETGIQFLPEKRTLVQARISKRIRTLKISNFEDYYAFLNSAEGATERKSLVSVLTTNVTRFFREDHHFDHLKTEVLPDLIKRARNGGRVRLWSAGCSSGEEPYSMAMSVLSLDRDVAQYDFKILASDLDPVVVTKAQAGIYRDSSVQTVPAPLNKTYFTSNGDGTSTVSDKLKELIAFRELNLMHPWPFKGSFDVIFCRNVVIYFDAPTSEKVWAKFAERLQPNGTLFVGHSARVGNADAIGLNAVGVTAYRKSGPSV